MAQRQSAGDAFRKTVKATEDAYERKQRAEYQAERKAALESLDQWLTAEAKGLGKKVKQVSDKIADQGYVGYSDLPIRISTTVPEIIGDSTYLIEQLKGLEKFARACKRLDIELVWETYSYRHDEERHDLTYYVVLKVDPQKRYLETGLIKDKPRKPKPLTQ